MRNNNRKVINKLAKKTLQNRVKSLFMIFSVILVTIMLYCVFSVGFSFYENYNVMNIRMIGTTAHLSIMNLNEEQTSKLNGLDYVKDFGVQSFCGFVNDGENEDYQIVLTHYSQSEWNNHIKPTISNFEGKLPEKEDEIAISRWTLDKLGYDQAQIGDELQLTLNTNDNISEKKLTISGIFTDYLIGRDKTTKSANVASQILYYNEKDVRIPQYGNILVSEKYALKNRISNASVTMIALKNENTSAEEIMNRIHKDLSLKEEQSLMSFGVSKHTNEGIAFVIVCILISFVIIFSGYMIINNIMEISVVNDIGYFGQLKTLGATSDQIKQIVKKQVINYYVISTPIGILLSCGISFIIVPYLLKQIISGTSIDAIMPYNVSFHPLLFLFVLLFVLFTLWISCLKPAKIAASISPIEALRYNGMQTVRKQRKTFFSQNGAKIYRMAIKNVFENRKKAFFVFLSLFVGLFLFIISYSVFSSPDYSLLFERQQPYNFNIEADNYNEEGLKSDIDDSDINKLMSLDDIKEIDVVRTSAASLKADEKTLDLYSKNIDSENGEFKATIIVLDEKHLKQFSKLVEQNDFTSFNNGESVIFNDFNVSEKNIGKSICLFDDHNQSYSFLIENLFTDDEDYLKDAENYLISDSDNICIYMSEKGVKKLGLNLINEEVKISTYSNDQVIEEQISLIFNDKNVIVKSQISTKESIEPVIHSLKMVASCFSGILVILGIFNFVNVIITSINSRRVELSILEAIGMSKRQVYKLLSCEGFIYSSITLLILIIIGLPLSKIIVNVILSILYYFTYTFSLSFMTVLVLSMIICCVIPPLFYKRYYKKPISERIKMNIE